MEIKPDLYARHGAREYWIVDPGNRYIMVYLIDDAGAYPEEPELYAVRVRPERPLVESMVLSGFSIDVNQLFSE
jgi:Uma2 family endonuclease